VKILINRTDAIGDTLLTMPMAQFIKEKYPSARVLFLVAPRCVPLFTNHPYIDEVWTIPTNRSRPVQLIFLFKRMLKENITSYFYVGGTHMPSFIAWLLRIKIRGGLKSRLASFFWLNRAIRQKRSMVEMHEVEYNLNLLKPLEIFYHYQEKNKIGPQIHLTLDEIAEGRKYLMEQWGEHKYIVIHPGMRGHTLNWPVKNYARFIERFERYYPGQFRYVISYTPSDGPYIAPIKEYFKQEDLEYLQDKILFLDGQSIGLRTYMGVVKNAALFLGPSTGTTHIAHQLNVPTLAIYSPIKVQSALRWAPFPFQGIKLMVPDVVCGERFFCAGVQCPYYECMGKIEVQDVVNNCATLLKLELPQVKK
jgi:heptosyltransferase III